MIFLSVPGGSLTDSLPLDRAAWLMGERGDGLCQASTHSTAQPG